MFNPFMCLIELWICVYIVLPIRIVRTLCKYLCDSKIVSNRTGRKTMRPKSTGHSDHLIEWKAAMKVRSCSKHTAFSILPRIIEDDAEVDICGRRCSFPSWESHAFAL